MDNYENERLHDQHARLQSLVDSGAHPDIPPPPATGMEANEDRQPLPKALDFGAYRLVRELGHGGMGVVWLAEQKSLGRRVALKLIRQSFASEELLRRFRNEAAILGKLQHPGIAHVYEFGTAPMGQGALAVEQPYFAMEFIRGVPLDEFVRQKELTAKDRLELVAQICVAVDHAHQNGVVHRDLKPANILVNEQGDPKILDFGIARATGSDTVAMSRHTVVGQVIGTVPYMSPEQVLGLGDEVDARSDVYALGAILYELLSGRLPVDVQGRSIAEAARVICDEEPTGLGKFVSTLRGDVDTIVLRALEKDRSRRYQSAGEFAADIRRYLASEPIVARPTTAFYRIAKFTRRNKGVVTATALLFLALVFGIVGTSWGLIAARDEAAHSRVTVQALIETLGKANPDVAATYAGTIRNLLDQASESVEAVVTEPGEEAEIRLGLGRAYAALGELELARAQLTAALVHREEVVDGASTKAKYQVLSPLVWILNDLHDWRFGRRHRQLARLRFDLLARSPVVHAAVDEMRKSSGEATLRPLEDLAQVSPDSFDDEMRALFAEELLFLGRGRARRRPTSTEGCALLRASIAWNPHGETHSTLVRTKNVLFEGLTLSDSTGAAEELARSILEALTGQGLRADSWYVALQRARIAACDQETPDTESTLLASLDTLQAAAGASRVHAVEIKEQVVRFYEQSGQTPEAERHRAEFANMLVDAPRTKPEQALFALGPEDSALRRAFGRLQSERRQSRVENGLDSVLQASQDIPDRDPKKALMALVLLRQQMAPKPRTVEVQQYCERILQTAVELCRHHADRIPNQLAETLTVLTRVQLQMGRTEAASRNAREAVALAKAHGRNDFFYHAYQGMVGLSMLVQGRFDEVVDLLPPHYDAIFEELGTSSDEPGAPLHFLWVAAAAVDRHAEVEGRMREFLAAHLRGGELAWRQSRIREIGWMVTSVPGYGDDIYKLVLSAVKTAGPGRENGPLAPHEILGRAHYRAGNNERAIECLQKDDMETIGTLAFEAMAQHKTGNVELARLIQREFLRREEELWARANFMKTLFRGEMERVLGN